VMCTEWCAMCAMGAELHVLHAPPFCMLFRMLLCMPLCILEAVEGELCLLEMPEVIRCVRVRMLEDVEGELCLLEALEAREVPEVMRRVLLCMLEAVEGGIYLLEVTEVMRFVLLYAGGRGR